MARPQIYFINLADRPDRRESLERQLQSLGLAAQRIKATTPADLTPREVARYCKPPRALGLTPREMSCAMSHFSAWRQFVAGGARHALILEDDAVLSSRLAPFIAEFGKAPIDGLIKLDPARTPLRLAAAAATLTGVEIRGLLGRTICSCAYLIDSATARWLLDHTELLLRRPIDIALFDPYSGLRKGVVLRHAVPALVTSLDRVSGPRPEAARGDIVDRKSEEQKTLLERTHEIWTALLDEFAARPHHLVQDALLRVRRYDVTFSPD